MHTILNSKNVNPPKMPEEITVALKVLTIIGSILSITGLILTIVTMIIFKYVICFTK